MGRDWMLYWTWDMAEHAVYAQPNRCSYVNSRQLGQVQPGDTVWIVSVTPPHADPASQLILVGHLRVAYCTQDVAEAARYQGAADLGDARWHAGCEASQAEPFTLVTLLAEARNIRFLGGQEKLTVFDGKLRPYALLSLRQLTPTSASRLMMYWRAGRAVAARLERA